MPPMKPGTRAYREAMRALRGANDTQDRVGLYVPNDKPARETLVPIGGRMSAVPGTKAFREVFAGAAPVITPSVTFILGADQQTATFPALPAPPTFTLNGDTAEIRSN